MISRDQLRDASARAANRLLAYPWKVWFWGDSIGLEGLLDAADFTGDQNYLAYVYGLLKGWIARESFRSEFDYTAPGVALLRVYESTRDSVLLEAALRHADYLSGFRKTTCGAYVRYENAAIELPPVLQPSHRRGDGVVNRPAPVNGGGPCVFVDCMHFDGPFFARLYAVTRDERYLELTAANILPQIELLYDPAERLFHHFWIERSRRPNGVLWARGNGWGLLGVALTIEGIGLEHPLGRRLSEVLRAGIARIADLQDSSGAWHTILTDPSSYVEASTAAFFTDIICRAVRLGLAVAEDYAKVLDAAMGYLLRQVRDDGTLDGVSYETFPSTRPKHYRTMPRGAMAPWGQGPLLAAIRSYADLTRCNGGRAGLHSFEGQSNAAR